MRTSRLLAGVAPALLFGLLPASAASAAALPTGFIYEPVVAGGFSSPTGFAELPDGRFLIVERTTAQIRLHAVGGTTAPVIHTVPNVATAGERGLLGIAVDPNWPSRPYVYVFFTRSDSSSHVQMLTAAGDLADPMSTSITLSSPYDLISGIPDFRAIHNGGTVRFGTDGMLYVSLGDDAVSCSAQNLSQLAGCILRVDVSAMPGAGGGPPPHSSIRPVDNPFPGPGNQQLIWLWGMRNPFRFTVDPATNDLVIGDVGLLTEEEIDVIPQAAGGANLGWPQLEGFSDPGLGLTCGLGNTFTDPVYSYPHGGVAAVICGPRYRTGAGALAFPAEYDGSVFLTDPYQGWLRRLVEAPAGWELAAPVAGQADPTNWGTEVPPWVDLQQGSDGALYCMQSAEAGGPAGLYRIAPVSPSSAPVPGDGSVRARAIPNPAFARHGARIAWSARHAGPHVVRVTDVAGRIVRAERLPVGSAGAAEWRWSGEAADGRALPAGTYFYTIEGPRGDRLSGKLVLLR